MLRRLSEQLIHTTREIFDDPVRGLRISLVALALLIVGSTLIYMQLEGMTPADALYMTVITISTVGFTEVTALSETGRLYTIVLILLGVGVATSVIGNSISIVSRPRLWIGIRRRTMEKYLVDIEQHYIVCGYGRMGQQVVADLRARDERLVVIDRHLNEDDLLEQGINFVVGDATHDDTLRHAGVERARGLVAALDNDASNVMAVLASREMNADLFIVARAAQTESESKLRRAGANRVVSPYQMGGHRLALALVRPSVDDFLDRIYSFTTEVDIDIGQVVVAPGSPLAAQTVGTCDLRETHHISILAVHTPSGEVIATPAPSMPIEAGSTLIVVGPPDKVRQLEAVEAGEKPPAS